MAHPIQRRRERRRTLAEQREAAAVNKAGDAPEPEPASTIPIYTGRPDGGNPDLYVAGGRAFPLHTGAPDREPESSPGPQAAHGRLPEPETTTDSTAEEDPPLAADDDTGGTTDDEDEGEGLSDA